MNRIEKQLVVDSLKESFSRSQAAFLVNIQGLTVVQTQALRKNLRKCGGVLKVAKNTLWHLAVADMSDDFRALTSHFTQQLAVVFAHEDMPGVAKAINNVAKENNALKIVVGFAEGAVIDAQKVRFIAEIPPRDQLLALLCGSLEQIIGQFVYVLEQIGEKREQ